MKKVHRYRLQMRKHGDFILRAIIGLFIGGFLLTLESHLTQLDPTTVFSTLGVIVLLSMVHVKRINIDSDQLE